MSTPVNMLLLTVTAVNIYAPVLLILWETDAGQSVITNDGVEIAFNVVQ